MQKYEDNFNFKAHFGELLEKLSGVFSPEAMQKLKDFCLGEKVPAGLEPCVLFSHAPASGTFHSNFDGGLLEHSARVADALCELTEKNGIVWSRPESPVIIGLFHDLCKTYNYETYVRNVKDDATGKWMQKVCYRTNCLYPIGAHGDQSVIMLQRMVGDALTFEEIACIRFHMGFSQDGDTSYVSAATKKWPNIIWTEAADQLSTASERIVE